MENLKSFEQLAVNAIKSGKSWNGKFYDSGKKGTFIFISGARYQVVNKEAFLEAVNRKEGKMTYGEAYRKHGMDFAEEGNW